MDLKNVLTAEIEKTRVLKIEISEGEILSLINIIHSVYDLDSKEYELFKELRSLSLKLEEGWEKGCVREKKPTERPEKYHGGLNMFKGKYDEKFISHGQFDNIRDIEIETSQDEILSILNGIPTISFLDSDCYITANILFLLGKKLRNSWVKPFAQDMQLS